MADYNNRKVAELITDAHEQFDKEDWTGIIWNHAMTAAKDLYVTYRDAMESEGLAGTVTNPEQSWEDWSTENEKGIRIIKGAFSKIDARLTDGYGPHLIWSCCASEDDRYSGWPGRGAPLYELYTSTIYDVGTRAYAIKPDLLEYVDRTPPTPNPLDASKWIRTMLDAFSEAAFMLQANTTRKEFRDNFSYDACDPYGALSDSDLKNWIESIIEPFFQEAMKEELYPGVEAFTDAAEPHPAREWTGDPTSIDPTGAMTAAAEAFQEKLEYAVLKRDIEYKEQCFLLSNIQEFASAKVYLDERGNKTFPHPGGYNSSLMLHGDPYSLINRLTQSPHKEEFFEMPTQAISALQPMIRLFKIAPDDSGIERQVEMKFDSHYRKEDVEEFMVTKEVRGHGIGIKSFTFSFEGADPFSATRSLKAKLVLFANTFDEFMKVRESTALHTIQGPEGSEEVSTKHFYRYIDLAIRTGGVAPTPQPQDTANPHNKDVRIEDTTKLNFRLKAIVGWQPGLFDPIVIPVDLLDAIYDSCITLNLTPTIHEFGIDEAGRTTLTINYWGSAEEFYDQPQFNIFTDPSVAVRQFTRRLRYKILNEYCDDDELKEKVIESKNSDKEAQNIKDEKMTNMRSLMTNMLDEKKIRFLNIRLEDLQKYYAAGPFRPLSDESKDELRSGRREERGFGTYELVTAGSPQAEEILSLTPAPATEGEADSTAWDQLDWSSKLSLGLKAMLNTPLRRSGQSVAWEMARDAEKAHEYNVEDPVAGISFFYVSDLIDTILKYIGITVEELPRELEALIDPSTSSDYGIWSKYEDIVREEINNYERMAKNYMKFRLILGPIELVDTNAEGKVLDSRLFNLGDIPISVKYFMEFLNERVFKRERETYTLPEFLNDFFNLFLRDFLNNDSCYGNRAKQKTILHKNVITAYNEPEKHGALDPIAFWCINNGRSRMDTRAGGTWLGPPSDKNYPILNVMGTRNNAGFDGGFENEIHYLTYFVARVQPTEQMLGCKKYPCYPTPEVSEPAASSDGGETIDVIAYLGDHEKGIWHYQIGKDRGIVKSIDLVKSDTPGLAEARWASEGYDNLQQLRVLYNANIKTFLDVNTYPGNYIYIEPRGFDPNADVDLTQFGIGGYFMIKSAEHTLGPGLAETTIDARWVNEISTGGLGKAPTQEIDKPPTIPKKCHAVMLNDRHVNTDLDYFLGSQGAPLKPRADPIDLGSEHDELSYDPLENRDDP